MLLGASLFIFTVLVTSTTSLENSSRQPGTALNAATITTQASEVHNSVQTVPPTIPDGYQLAATFTSQEMMMQFSVDSSNLYYVEVCGAQGSNNCNNPYGVSYGGLGGCIYSYLTSPPETLFITVGGQGTCSGGGSNGGGKGHCADESVGQFGGGGGGSSDIRSSNNLASRIVVGGGGGGAGYDSCTGLEGGNGGGLVAGAGSFGQTWASPVPGLLFYHLTDVMFYVSFVQVKVVPKMLVAQEVFFLDIMREFQGVLEWEVRIIAYYRVSKFTC